MCARIRVLCSIAGALFVLVGVLIPQAGADVKGTMLEVRIAGEGTVSGSGGYSCPDSPLEFEPGVCGKYYDKHAVVNLAASPKPGWIFAGWSGCAATAGAICQVVIPEQLAPLKIAVTFKQVGISPTQRPLTVSVTGPGQVAGSGIDCPSDCSESFIAGASVTLQAHAKPLATFTGWSGACSGGPGSACVVKMDVARNVTANFAADISIGIPKALVVGLAGPGSGSVASGSAINCPGDCTQEYLVAADVTLTASPSSGSVFEGWSGACSGTAPTCQLTMSRSQSVTAVFGSQGSDGQAGDGDPGSPGSPSDPGQSGGVANPGQSGGSVNPVDPATPGQTGGGSHSAGACTLTGTPGRDLLVGTPRRDVICGLGGNDRLVGKGGDDVLLGGPGADVLIGGPGHDRLVGGAGADRLSGGIGRDRLVGGPGSDRLVGGLDIDRLMGSGGRDVLLARDRLKDFVDGGVGIDRARVDRTMDVTRLIESRF